MGSADSVLLRILPVQPVVFVAVEVKREGAEEEQRLRLVDFLQLLEVVCWGSFAEDSLVGESVCQDYFHNVYTLWQHLESPLRRMDKFSLFRFSVALMKFSSSHFSLSSNTLVREKPCPPLSNQPPRIVRPLSV